MSWYCHDFVMILTWFCHDFVIFTHLFMFIMSLQWFCHDFVMILSWFCNDFAMILSWFCNFYLHFSFFIFKCSLISSILLFLNNFSTRLFHPFINSLFICFISWLFKVFWWNNSPASFISSLFLSIFQKNHGPGPLPRIPSFNRETWLRSQSAVCDISET